MCGVDNWLDYWSKTDIEYACAVWMTSLTTGQNTDNKYACAVWTTSLTTGQNTDIEYACAV